MADLFKCKQYRITDEEIINLSTGEKFSTHDIKAERTVIFPPSIKDYIGFGAAALAGIWFLTKGWTVIGVIALIIGGIGIYVSTKRKTRYHLVVWHVGDQTTHLVDFENNEDMQQASNAIAQLVSRNRKSWEND